ncbi:MAG: glycosyltransferase family 39 protein [Anaerolineae bacterium]|nr:glycosyltransferase family 39 protein [Anaerolineae bacterium]
MIHQANNLRIKQTRTALTWLTQLDVGLILLILVVLTSLQLAPSVIDQGRDSGIFAYVGQVIRDGGVPYRDAWDNKPPGVYYINAFAFAVFGTNRWALWFIETITVFLTGLLLFSLLSQVYKRRFIAWVGTLSFVFLTRHPALVPDTNFTEVYALLPQVMAFFAGYLFLRQQRGVWAFMLGLSVGLAFLIKQTTVGVALMFIPAIIVSRHSVVYQRLRWRWLGIIACGGLSALGAVSLYLLKEGVLLDAINATFISPVAFHKWVSRGLVQNNVSVWSTYQALSGSVAPIVIGPVTPFLMAGAVIAARRVAARPYSDDEAAANATLMIWTALTFVADLILANSTTRGHGHYYVTILPAMVLLISLAVSVVPPVQRQSRFRTRIATRLMYMYLIYALAGGAVAGALVRLWLVDWNVRGPLRNESLSVYVTDHTNPEDKVLVWGATSSINFQSERLSPTQYHYGYPLIVPDYTAEDYVWETVNDLETNQPELIVDGGMVDGNRVPPLDPVRRQQWWNAGGRRDIANLEPVYQFVADHCTYVDEIEGRVIYECEY